MMWKSTSSSGWEYFLIMKELRFEAYVCQLCVNLIACYLSDIFYLGVWYYIPRGVGIIMKH